MCTSITFETKSGQHFLSRTMDFAFELDANPVVIPRNYEYSLEIEKRNMRTKYGFTGSARNFSNYLFADGVNEKGLAVAELYYPHFAEYVQEAQLGSLNLAPHEFIFWVLSQLGSINEVRQRLNEVTLVAKKVDLLDIIVPLHFILSDPTGETIVIETENQTLTIKENPVHVMTNSPNFEWHLTNLNNYLFLKPENYPNKSFGNYIAHPLGQGSGTSGLPGGVTPPERFVRAAFLREYVEMGETHEETLTAMFRVLDNLTIPKGINLEDDGSVDYTQYRSIFDLKNLTYYFNPYHSSNTFCVQLTEKLLNAAAPLDFEINTSFDTIPLA